MARFCPECGAAAEGANFCPECGTALNGQTVASPAARSEIFKYSLGRTLEVGADGIKDGDHFVPYSQIRSIDKGGGKWLGYDLEIVWGDKGLWASDHSSGHEFVFGDDVESRDRAYDLITSRIAAASRS
jgi:zinc-ribbon domain